jgi:polar amino acid transport system substrate-binding protein
VEQRHSTAPSRFFVTALSIGISDLPSAALAQNDGTSLRVATFTIQPFVMQNNGALTGFSIDLWHEVANRVKTRSDFVIDGDVAALFENLRSKKSDLAVFWDLYHRGSRQGFRFQLPDSRRRTANHGSREW